MPANPVDIVKKAHSKSQYTEQHIVDLLRSVEDPVYFIENFVRVQHPVKGNVPFLLYPYQREMIDAFKTHRLVVALTGRQLGKTASAAAFILWRTMFIPDTTVLVTANKFASALEVMNRIRFTYEHLPDHIRAGVVEYNKGTLTFDNGSSIVSRATSKDAGRGLSISLLYCDEFAFVVPSKQSEFYQSILPVLSTGGGAIVTSTPNNDEDQFAQLWRGAIDTTDEYGNTLPGGVGRNGFFGFKATWREHPERDEEWAKQFRVSLGEIRFRQEMEADFVSSDETLIDPLTLVRIHGREPAFYTGTTRWYHEPAPDHTFLVALDPSLGTGGDHAAIQVFQLPEMIQIAEWQHNRSVPTIQVRTLLQILFYLRQSLRDNDMQTGEPDIYWTVENNTIGEAILQIIEDTGEENFPGNFVHERKRKGQVRRFRKGMNTDNRKKLSACARCKSLIESGRMQINSAPLVHELKNFVAKERSYSAKPGEHDDLVSALLLICRMLDVVLNWSLEEAHPLREMVNLREEVEPMPIVLGFN